MDHLLSHLFLCSTSTARIRRCMIKTRIRTKAERRRGRKNDRRQSLNAGQVYGSNGGPADPRRKSGKRRRRRRRKRKSESFYAFDPCSNRQTGSVGYAV